MLRAASRHEFPCGDLDSRTTSSSRSLTCRESRPHLDCPGRGALGHARLVLRRSLRKVPLRGECARPAHRLWLGEVRPELFLVASFRNQRRRPRACFGSLGSSRRARRRRLDLARRLRFTGLCVPSVATHPAQDLLAPRAGSRLACAQNIAPTCRKSSTTCRLVQYLLPPRVPNTINLMPFAARTTVVLARPAARAVPEKSAHAPFGSSSQEDSVWHHVAQLATRRARDDQHQSARSFTAGLIPFMRLVVQSHVLYQSDAREHATLVRAEIMPWARVRMSGADLS